MIQVTERQKAKYLKALRWQKLCELILWKKKRKQLESQERGINVKCVGAIAMAVFLFAAGFCLGVGSHILNQEIRIENGAITSTFLGQTDAYYME